MTFTAELRQELSWAKNAKLIRQGVYDVGILLGAVLLADKIDIIAKVWPWPEHAIDEPALRAGAWLFALALWIGIIFKRNADWKAIARLEKGLDRDEVEREMGRSLSNDELKNLGLK
jgi:hypothetical protein